MVDCAPAALPAKTSPRDLIYPVRLPPNRGAGRVSLCWGNERRQFHITPCAGSFGRLYRGLVPPLMLEAPKRAVKFSANRQDF